jgi:hypothetical protein
MAITISGDGSITGLAVGGLPDNVVDKDTLAVGVQSKVLQVVSATYSTNVANSTTTYADTGLTATITPSATTSKILVIIHQAGGYKNNGNSDNGIDAKLLRGATDISQFAKNYGLNGITQSVYLPTASTSYLDSPATTSATTYKTQFANNAAAAEVRFQVSSHTMSTITLMEIGV